MGVAPADLRQSEVLGCLPGEALDALAGSARPRRYAAGETVFEEGSPGDCLHLVVGGAFEVRRTEGAELYVLAELGPGHAFGELAVLDRTPRTATVVAVLDSETVQIGAAELDAVLEAHPDAVRRMLGVLARLLIEEKELVIRDNWMLERRVRERTQDLRNSQLEIVHRLGQVAESRDPETGRHITRMSRVCAHLAQDDRDVAGRLRDAAARGADARHRQGRRARLDPPQARAAGRRRARPDAAAHHGRRRDPLRQPLPDRADGGGDRADPPRALGRLGLPARAARRPRSRWWAASARSATCSTR